MRSISRPQPEKCNTPHPDLVIAELAARQHGVVARRQLLAAGVSDDAIAHRLALRRLHRLHAGAFSIGERPGQLGLFMAAVLACGDGALLSHRSAAALWDLARDRGPIDVLVVGGPRTRRGLSVHRSRSLDPADAATHQGIPCTSVARTLVDMASVAGHDELRRLLERSIVLRLFDNHQLTAALDRANGRRGTGTLRRLVTDLDENLPPTRSEFERRFHQLIKEASLPRPVTNELVNGYEVDFHWPDARLIVETDGRATHDNPLAFERDRQRDLDLTLAGWHVIRISWRQLTTEPDRVVALLRAKLG